MCEQFDQITSCTAETKASIIFAFFLYWIACIAQKNKSKKCWNSESLLVDIRRISNPLNLEASQKSRSSNFKWEGALSCWMKISLPTSSLGHLAQMTGNTWLIIKSLITYLVIEVMGSITKSPRTRSVLSLPLWAGLYRTSEKQPILP